MLKVLFLPLNWSSVIQEGWYDAFREAGCQLEIFDHMTEYQSMRRKVGRVREAFLKSVNQFKPDLLHLQIQHTTVINGGIISKTKQMNPKMIVSNWTGDCRSYIPKTYKDVAKFADFNLISSTGQIDKFHQEIQKPIHYLQIGYNPKLYYPDPDPQGNFAWDCIFIAHHNPKEKYPGAAARMNTCKLLRDKFGDRFALYGDGWPKNFKSLGSIDQRTVAQAYHKSKVVISISHFNDINHYFSDRLLMCMASGRPTVQMHFPKYESYFSNNSDLVIASSPEDIVKKTEWLIANPEMANFIGQNGADKVFAEHTYLSRVNELLKITGLK